MYICLSKHCLSFNSVTRTTSHMYKIARIHKNVGHNNSKTKISPTREKDQEGKWKEVNLYYDLIVYASRIE